VQGPPGLFQAAQFPDTLQFDRPPPGGFVLTAKLETKPGLARDRLATTYFPQEKCLPRQLILTLDCLTG
jgi:hypothetical protein